MSSAEIDTLTERLNQLAMQNRRFRFLASVVLVGLAVFGILGQAAPRRMPNEIEAAGFVVRDTAGRPRILLTLTGSGEPSLVLADEHGQPRVALALNGDVPALRLSGPGGRGGVVVATLTNGLTAVRFYDRNDKGRSSLGLTGEGEGRLRRIEEGEGRVESELERQVVQRLVSAGYRVTSQWKAGTYRIDLVVQGGQRRLAVECDGDRYHTLENLADDMGRQAVLERLGWRFVRVRGTEFFRDAERAMRPVWAKMEQFGIPPEGHVDASNDSRPAGSELHERLIRRVQELRLGREKRDDEAAGSANRHRVVLEEVARVQEASAASQVSKPREFRESLSITKVDGAEVLAEKPILDRARGQYKARIEGLEAWTEIVFCPRSGLI